MKYALIKFFLLVTLNSIAQGTKLHFLTKETGRVSIHSRYYYQFEAKDSMQDPVVYSTGILPPWIQFDKATHSISGLAPKAGQYPIHLVASDGKDTAHQYFMLTVYDKQTMNILPLGNSITNGTAIYNSYRRNLWYMLHNDYYNFDFIGSWNKHHAGGKMPNEDFDLDHEGHSGWTVGHILQQPGWDSSRGNLHQWLKNYSPDIVLIELGTNDVFQCVQTDTAMKNLSSIVSLLREKNKKVKIFIAQIPPLGKQWSDKKLCGDSIDYAQRIIQFNKAVVNFAKNNSTRLSLIKTVDQYSGVDPSTDMYDDIHPNDKGEKIMAERWFNAIKGYFKKINND